MQYIYITKKRLFIVSARVSQQHGNTGAFMSEAFDNHSKLSMYRSVVSQQPNVHNIPSFSTCEESLICSALSEDVISEACSFSSTVAMFSVALRRVYSVTTSELVWITLTGAVDFIIELSRPMASCLVRLDFSNGNKNYWINKSFNGDEEKDSCAFSKSPPLHSVWRENLKRSWRFCML